MKKECCCCCWNKKEIYNFTNHWNQWWDYICDECWEKDDDDEEEEKEFYIINK